MFLTWSSFTLASLRSGQQTLNIVYVLADKSSKQSSHFNRLGSILCANGPTHLFLFSINTPLFSHAMNYLSSFPSFHNNDWKDMFVMYKRDCSWNVFTLHSDGKSYYRLRNRFTWGETYLSYQSICWKVDFNFLSVYLKHFFWNHLVPFQQTFVQIFYIL